jgi:hypothetical protein
MGLFVTPALLDFDSKNTSSRMIWLLPHLLLTLSCQQVVYLSHSSCESPVELTDEGGVGGGAKSYDCETAWYSINHSIRVLSARQC